MRVRGNTIGRLGVYLGEDGKADSSANAGLIEKSLSKRLESEEVFQQTKTRVEQLIEEAVSK